MPLCVCVWECVSVRVLECACYMSKVEVSLASNSGKKKALGQKQVPIEGLRF